MPSGWSNVATTYDDTSARLCAGANDDVLAAAHLTPGDRVLDAGGGTGRLAERLVATGARVALAEPDPSMLSLAGARLHDSVRLERAGLPDLPFADASFGVVIAHFVVNHLEDPRAGVAELTRVTAPGGRVIVTIWPSGRTAQSRLWDAVIEETGAVRPAGVRLPADRDFPRTEEGLAGLLTGAGLADVTTRRPHWTHRGETDELWRGAVAGIGGIGAVVTGQSEEVRARMRTAYDRLVGDLTDPTGGLAFEAEAVLAVGTRPPGPGD